MRNFMNHEQQFTHYSGKQENRKVWKIIPVMLFLLISIGLSAQNFEKFETKMANAGKVEFQYLDKLVSGINPNINLTSGFNSSSQSEKPVIAITDAGSIQKLFEGNPDLKQIEMIKLTIDSPSDIQVTLYVDQLVNFDKLSYVLIVFSYDVCGNKSDVCLEAIAKNIIRGENENIEIMYRLLIPN